MSFYFLSLLLSLLAQANTFLSGRSIQPLRHTGVQSPSDSEVPDWDAKSWRVPWMVFPDTQACFLDSGTMRGCPLDTNDCF